MHQPSLRWRRSKTDEALVPASLLRSVAVMRNMERMVVVMKTQRHLRIISGETTPRPPPAPMAEPEKHVPRTEQKAQVRKICAGIRARLEAVPFKVSLSPETDT